MKIFRTFDPCYKGLGILMILIAFNMSTYYNVILAYSYHYFFSSFLSPLPWEVEGKEIFNRDYFYNEVIKQTETPEQGGAFVYPILFLYMFSMLICFFCIRKGASVSGKIAVFTAISPYVLLLILLIRGITLPGSSLGLEYLFFPKWSHIFSFGVWADAAN